MWGKTIESQYVVNEMSLLMQDLAYVSAEHLSYEVLL